MQRSGVVGPTVYLVATKFEGTVYAAKEVEKRKFMKNGILDIKVGNEMKIMSKLKHVSPDYPPLGARLTHCSRILSSTLKISTMRTICT
jgi:hypothetical protein